MSSAQIKEFAYQYQQSIKQSYAIQKLVNKAKACVDNASYPQALKICQHLAEQLPDSSEIHYNLGIVYVLNNQLNQAVKSFQNSLLLKPNNEEAIIALFNCCKRLKQAEFGCNLLENYAKLYPSNNVYHYLASYYIDTGYHAAAKVLLEHNLKNFPSLENQIIFNTTMSPMITSTEAEDKTFNDSLDKLKAILNSDAPPKDYMPVNGNINFYIAYYHKNPKLVLELLNKIWRKFYPKTKYVASHVKKWMPKKSNDKIKLGIFSTNFTNYIHSISRVFRGLITNLPPDKFDITIFESIENTNRVVKNIDNTTVINLPFDTSARQAIAKQKLDILLYTDIGMDFHTYFMAHARLAPIQCVLPGHPITSGVDTIDYYISGKDFEMDTGAEEFYTEKLLKLSTTPIFYEKPILTPTHHNLSQFNLPLNKNFYFCTGLEHKISPHMDKAFKLILQKDPKAVILILKGHPDSMQILLDRLSINLQQDVERVMAIPFMQNNTFLNLLKLVHAPLDSFFFAGGNTALQALGAGVPLVTLPDKMSYSRGTYAQYVRMGIYDCIANSIRPSA